MDRLDEWRVFATVAAQQSFVAAARRHGRSPQVITRAVAALEARVGARLLSRTTRSVALTDEGARYLARARALLADFDALEAPVAGAELRGTLTVAAPVLFGQLHVAPLVHAFLVEHAGLDVRLLLHDRVVSLADEGVDVAVRLGALPDSSLRARLLGHVRARVCASPAYLERRGTPRDPAALAGHDCIAFAGTTPTPDRWTFQVPGARARSVTVRARLVVNTGQAALDAARAGLGLVRVLSYQCAHDLERGTLRAVLRRYEPEPVPVQLVQLPGVASRAASAFADFVSARLRPHPR